jgi:hypothetical protein
VKLKTHIPNIKIDTLDRLDQNLVIGTGLFKGTKGLNELEVNKRPIHCSDAKRETLYIKHEDTWEKEEPEKTKLKKAVNQVARMNLSQLPKWQRENPESEVLDTKENDEYIRYSMMIWCGVYLRIIF